MFESLEVLGSYSFKQYYVHIISAHRVPSQRRRRGLERMVGFIRDRQIRTLVSLDGGGFPLSLLWRTVTQFSVLDHFWFKMQGKPSYKTENEQ